MNDEKALSIWQRCTGFEAIQTVHGTFHRRDCIYLDEFLHDEATGTVSLLIEVKAIGLELKDADVRQAVDYAANQGVDWVLLTNGTRWRVYHIIFAKPIYQELVIDIDFCALNARSESDLELLYLWCKEGWVRSVLGEYHIQKQALSRFFLGAMILTDPVIDVIRRELRRMSPDVGIESEQIRTSPPK